MNGRRRLFPELIYIHDPDGGAHRALAGGMESKAHELSAQLALQFRMIPAQSIIPLSGAPPRLMHGPEDLLSRPRLFIVNRSSLKPGAQRFLQALCDSVADSDSVLLNDTIEGSYSSERDKVVMACHAAKLGIAVPSFVAIPFGAFAQAAVSHAPRLCPGPWIVKARESGGGRGAIKADTLSELAATIDIVARTGASYLIQAHIPNMGALHVVIGGEEVSCALSHAVDIQPDEYSKREGRGWEAVTAPDEVVRQSRRLSASLGARFICIEWLLTTTGPVLNKWTTATCLEYSHVHLEIFFKWLSRHLARENSERNAFALAQA